MTTKLEGTDVVLYELKEAAAALGYMHEGVFYQWKRQGHAVHFTRQRDEKTGRLRTYISEPNLAQLRILAEAKHATGQSTAARQNNGKRKLEPKLTAEQLSEEDPLVQALVLLDVQLRRTEDALRNVRRAVKAHDKELNRTAILQFLEGLSEGVAKA